MLKEAIKIAKGDDVEKVGMSVNMPITLKEQLVALAQINEVSTNALICSILQLALDDNGVRKNSILGEPLVRELERLELKRQEILSYVDDNNGLDEKIDFERGLINELKSLEETIKTLKWVLV
jgi:hypothetical protein